MVFIVTVLRRIGRGLFLKLYGGALFFGWLMWDMSISLVNLIAFKRKVGHVIPKDHPGGGGVWPEYIPPKEGDSRCSCPALNALANHGIISRDGRNLTFRDVSAPVQATYNVAPSFSALLLCHSADFLNRSYRTGRFDLSDIDGHNCVEHDASLVRRDTYEQFYQGIPDGKLVDALIRSATGPPPSIKQQQKHCATAPSDLDFNRTFTASDISRRLGERRREAQRSNPQYSQDFKLKFVGSLNGASLLRVFGGRLSDIYTFLKEERLPDGWESHSRDRMGLTFTSFSRTAFGIELGIEDELKEPLNLM